MSTLLRMSSVYTMNNPAFVFPGKRNGPPLKPAGIAISGSNLVPSPSPLYRLTGSGGSVDINVDLLAQQMLTNYGNSMPGARANWLALSPADKANYVATQVISANPNAAWLRPSDVSPIVAILDTLVSTGRAEIPTVPTTPAPGPTLPIAPGPTLPTAPIPAPSTTPAQVPASTATIPKHYLYLWIGGALALGILIGLWHGQANKKEE